MRVGVLLAALLSLAVLAIHLWVPLATVETVGDDGAVLQETLSRGEVASRLADGIDVPGATPGYLLAGAVVLAAGGLALLACALPGPGGRWSLFGGALTVGLGAAMSLHGNALWVGRGVSSLIHGGITQAATPTAAHEPWNALTPNDVLASIVPISPLAIAAVALLVLVLLVTSVARSLPVERGLQDMARRHARLVAIGGVALLAVAVIPWVVQDLPVDPDAEGGASHIYFWSAYDILQKEAAGQQLANGVGEAGVIPWNALAVVLQIAFVGGVIAILAPMCGITGRYLESIGQGVFGRLLENGSLASIAAYGALFVAGLLASFFMQHPTAFQDAVTTGLPLVASAIGLGGLIVSGMQARRVLAVDGDMVADDFPEPVVYD